MANANATVTVVSLEDAEFTLPNLANATPEFLVDQIGQVKARLKNLEKYEGVFTQALLARLMVKKGTEGPEEEPMLKNAFGEHQGEKFIATIEPAVGSMRLNADKVKAYVGNDEDVYRTLCAQTESKGYKLTVKPKVKS